MAQILELIRRVRQQLVDLWQRTAPRDRTRFFVISIAALAAIVVAAFLLSRTNYVVLYGDMSPTDAGEVYQILTGMGVKVQTEGTGTILVPEKRLGELSMTLAAQGYPKSGVTYEYMEKATGFSTTAAEKREYKTIQTQERLRTAINMNAGIRDCIITIAQPDSRNTLFPSEIVPSTASVILQMMPEAVLSNEQITSIETLVSSSVEGLQPENVTITDDSFRRLNHMSDDDFTNIGNNYLMEQRVRDELQRSILALLAPIFRRDHVRADVHVKLNFDDIQTEEVRFRPVLEDEGEGIVVSLRETSEKATGGYAVGGRVGVDPNGGDDVAEYPEPTDNYDQNYEQSIREINYEVNQLVEKITRAKGSIESMTASIVIDNQNLSEENNDATTVQNIVAGVLGMERSDYNRISVSFMKLDGVADDAQQYQEYLDELKRQQLFELIRDLVLIGMIVAGVLIIVLRIMKLLHVEPSEAEKLAMGQAEGELDEYSELVRLATQNNTEDIEVAGKSPTWQKVEDFVDRSPDMVANLLRNWINEETQKGGRR